MVSVADLTPLFWFASTLYVTVPLLFPLAPFVITIQFTGLEAVQLPHPPAPPTDTILPFDDDGPNETLEGERVQGLGAG
jgi:hypothetical protein